jgi:hypothetical protein
MLEAELKCARSPAAPYSKKLAALNLTIKFWKIMKSGIKTKTDVTEILNQMEQTINKRNNKAIRDRKTHQDSNTGIQQGTAKSK